MASEPTNDVAAFRAKLEAQKAAIEEMLSALDRYAAVGVAVALPVSERSVDPANIPDDAFFGLSIGEAAKKYLGIVKRKQSIREIAEALDRGGLPHASGDFVATVATMLGRHAKKDTDLVRVGRGDWGLAAWYGNRRPAKASTSKPVSKRAPKAKKATASKATGMTAKAMASAILREHAAPMHIEQMMAAIEKKFGRSVLKDTLVGDLSRGVKKNEFVRVEPSVYGLS